MSVLIRESIISQAISGKRSLQGLGLKLHCTIEYETRKSTKFLRSLRCEKEVQEYAITEIAKEWDNMEYALQDDEFFSFLVKDKNL